MEEHMTTVHQSCSDSVTNDDILHNLDGHMHGPMAGFVKKHFGSFQHKYQDARLEIQDSTGEVSSYAVPRAPPIPEQFLDWFSSCIAQTQDSARCCWYVEKEFDNESARLSLASLSSPISERQHPPDPADIDVIGQFYQKQDVHYQDGLLRLFRSAYDVFAGQPTRLFLHGLYIRGSLIELWVFDRSGSYCSDVIDMRQDFVQFISILYSYQHMTREALGRSQFLQRDHGGAYAILGDLGKMYLEDRPIASRDGLVGSGMFCFRARRLRSDGWTHVIKLKWRWARHRPEDELLRLAKDRGVRGAVSVDHYEELEDTAYLRRGLRWGPQKRFKAPDPLVDNDATSESQQCDGFAEYTEETQDFFQKRILTCIVTSPVGRPLHSFRSLTELLQVFGSAIKCHRSLYEDAGILHQDVSPGNIIIINDPKSEGVDGILIDLDVATEIDADASFERGITGTRPFMAIGALKGEPRTFRHDLESFFYVFLWLLICKGADSPPTSSMLCGWGRSESEYDYLAKQKSLDMAPEGLRAIQDEIPHEYSTVRPLVSRLHSLLFCPRDGTIRTRTDTSPDDRGHLYDGMVLAFGETIN